MGKSLSNWNGANFLCSNSNDIKVITDSIKLDQLPEIMFSKMFITVSSELFDQKTNLNVKNDNQEIKQTSAICFRYIDEKNHVETFIGINLECFNNTKPNNIFKKNENIHYSHNESQLLSWFLNIISKLDPDFLISYKIHDIILKHFIQKLKMYDMNAYSKIGRFKNTCPIKRVNIHALDKYIMGRCLIDLNSMFKELIPGISNETIYGI